jgi:hypothetical protein
MICSLGLAGFAKKGGSRVCWIWRTPCAEVGAVRDGGGSIVGRNTFQRPKREVLGMLSKILKIYQGKD